MCCVVCCVGRGHGLGPGVLWGTRGSAGVQPPHSWVGDTAWGTPTPPNHLLATDGNGVRVEKTSPQFNLSNCSSSKKKQEPAKTFKQKKAPLHASPSAPPPFPLELPPPSAPHSHPFHPPPTSLSITVPPSPMTTVPPPLRPPGRRSRSLSPSFPAFSLFPCTAHAAEGSRSGGPDSPKGRGWGEMGHVKVVVFSDKRFSDSACESWTAFLGSLVFACSASSKRWLAALGAFGSCGCFQRGGNTEISNQCCTKKAKKNPNKDVKDHPK